ncbi:DUF4031 domain-containing protein [Glutamicibacter nicotianae]|uniref:DUF4031 domain-containing protein n=1 Tax=Glutamicibacter nicotianae TaxID=37929 RepID=A0ABQ0RMZ5_GLUNI|nr:DUF4031 domain-containing protein [Glutamicibacter nicotianae]GEC13150.1 hypothetical protein ANI01nite_23530 [Glutamicibacter nicotianae]
MSILIDPPRWPAHGTLFAHLVSDTSLAELHQFAEQQDISRRAFDRDHYDVPRERYDQLVSAGALEVSGSELVRALVKSGIRIPAKYRPEKLGAVLARRWSRTLPTEPQLGSELLGCWSQSHRHYHDRVHLLSVLEAIDWLAKNQADHEELMLLQLAAWFHDAVYEGTSEDEFKSAIMARERLWGVLSPGAVSKVSDLVMLTATHAPAETDRLGHILCDADLEVLARPAAAYQRYAEAVYKEYEHLPRHVLAAGRSKILASSLEKERIYGTPAGYQRWDRSARHNLQTELELLRGWL